MKFVQLNTNILDQLLKAAVVYCAGERFQAVSPQRAVVQRQHQHNVDELQPVLLRPDHHCARQLQRGRQQPSHFGKQTEID
jgi:hypothetical protein